MSDRKREPARGARVTDKRRPGGSFKVPTPHPPEHWKDKPDATIEWQVLYKSPSPDSVLAKASTVMDELGDKIVARAFRKLAEAEANGVADVLAADDVIAWLDEEIEHLYWVRDYVTEHADMALRQQVPALLPKDYWKRCEWCEEPFVPSRRGHRFCHQRCRVAAHRAGEGR